MYRGRWQDGQKEGQGEEVFPDGAKFVGHYHCNKKEGRGKLFMAEGCYFQGFFENDRAVGPECQQRGRDYFYEGPFVDSDFHGAGRVSYSTSRGMEKYIGEFERGKKHGYGEYTWADGSVYKGQWIRGDIANKGVFIEGS